MSKVKISVVSYLNSKPFIFGLENSELINKIDLQLDIPSVCAQKLQDGIVDVGLIPVAIIPQLKESYIISDYCIGAESNVVSVCLYSDVPLDKIETILLDYQSKTSVVLVKILAQSFWKINPKWENSIKNFEDTISEATAGVIIGDRTFGINSKYTYKYDLAEEWIKFTGLPFVFACWVSNKQLPVNFINNFNSALAYGIDNIMVISAAIQEKNDYTVNVEEYLTNNISYSFSERKKQGLAMFLEYLKNL